MVGVSLQMADTDISRAEMIANMYFMFLGVVYGWNKYNEFKIFFNKFARLSIGLISY